MQASVSVKKSRKKYLTGFTGQRVKWNILSGALALAFILLGKYWQNMIVI
jgi:hypothetical protein